MVIQMLPYDFSVCQIETAREIDLTTKYCFVGKTEDELSLVCQTEHVPFHTVAREDGWRAFRIEGVLDFSLVGILSHISTILAEEQIGIFVISTYNTDYILVKRENEHRAQMALQTHGYTVETQVEA